VRLGSGYRWSSTIPLRRVSAVVSPRRWTGDAICSRLRAAGGRRASPELAGNDAGRRREDAEPLFSDHRNMQLT
jgi:hypothetical protein